ncbi:MAG: toll/interleukin-1 receptor domain-containing protein [Methylococcales bacterium]
MIMYELAVLGDPTDRQVTELEDFVSQAIKPLGLNLGDEVGWSIRQTDFAPSAQKTSAAVFYGGKSAVNLNVQALLRRGIPILPVVSDLNRVSDEIPEALRPLNCISYDTSGPRRIATALLECAGLLPKQRRIFVSYRRNETSEAALQLFNELSARHFEVFLDTHDIAPAEDFQTMLWHRLCDSDVLVMLDSPRYFDSRWTNAEFGRALAKTISILRIGWPNVIQSRRSLATNQLELQADELDAVGRFTACAIHKVCLELEALRSKGNSVRSFNMMSKLRLAMEQIGGSVVGVGLHKSVLVRLPNGDKEIVVYPTVGIPTAVTLHEATINSPDRSVAVIYDAVGIHPDWQRHLDWLGSEIKATRWVKEHEVSWSFAGWETLI